MPLEIYLTNADVVYWEKQSNCPSAWGKRSVHAELSSDSNTPASVPTLPKINRQDTGCGLPTALVSVSIAVINTLTKIKLGRKGFSSDYSL